MKKRALLAIIALASFLLISFDAVAGGVPKANLKEFQGEAPKNRPILQRWEGDYPVAQLGRLPAGQRQSRVGYIGDAETFASVWQVLKPGTSLPRVDFDKNLVVFVRNLESYHHALVEKVTLKDGVADIVSVQPLMPAPAIEDRVAMGLAVISREGLNFIQADNEKIPVR